MISNSTFPFYTSTARQDANRTNTAFVRICPRQRLLPFQIQVSTGLSASSVSLVDCDGGITSLATGYFSSIGTTIVDDSSVGVKDFTSVGYMQYAGGALGTELPYGVYYLRVGDGTSFYYSEHFSVRDIDGDRLNSWTSPSYDTFISSGGVISTAINIAGGAQVLSNIGNTVAIGDKLNFQCDLTLNSGQLPSVKIVDEGDADSSATTQLVAGFNDIEITLLNSQGSDLKLLNTDASSFSVSFSRLMKNSTDYIKFEFSNTNDLIHSGTDDIMYSTGGWKQRVYLDTQLNLPKHEPIEVGEELDGVFISEQLNSTYIFQVVDYVSRSMYNGMQYLFMHDSITITDEVGNEYTPGVGNGRVGMDWGTFDTGSLRVEFNDGSMTWVNDQADIT